MPGMGPARLAWFCAVTLSIRVSCGQRDSNTRPGAHVHMSISSQHPLLEVMHQLALHSVALRSRATTYGCITAKARSSRWRAQAGAKMQVCLCLKLEVAGPNNPKQSQLLQI